jgi:tricorn protease-like protein
MAMSPDRKFCVTGQRGPSPTLFAWSTTIEENEDCEKIFNKEQAEVKQRFQLARGARGIAACTISADGKYVACVDMSNDHNVWVFNIETGAQEFKQKGDTNYIYDIAFTKKEGEYTLMTSGKNHLYFWDF